MGIFVRRGENKRKAGERRRGWPLALACGAVFALAPVLYLRWEPMIRWTSHLRDSLLGHSYFSVREIQVRGGEKMGGNEIVAMAGLSRGMSLWQIDPLSIEKKVARHPWVKRVFVRREFPHRVVIEVEERAAKGILVLAKLYYVDSDGFVFKEIGEGETMGLPLLTGLQRADLVSQAQSNRQKIQEALKLADVMEKAALGISEIHFSPGGLIVYPMSRAVPLQMGWGDWPEKLARLERILALWRGREAQLATLDLSYRGQVVARLKKVPGLQG